MRDICEIEEKLKKRPTVLSSSQLGHSLFSLSSLSDVETIDVESKFQLPRCQTDSHQTLWCDPLAWCDAHDADATGCDGRRSGFSAMSSQRMSARREFKALLG